MVICYTLIDNKYTFFAVLVLLQNILLRSLLHMCPRHTEYKAYVSLRYILSICLGTGLWGLRIYKCSMLLVVHKWSELGSYHGYSILVNVRSQACLQSIELEISLWARLGVIQTPNPGSWGWVCGNIWLRIWSLGLNRVGGHCECGFGGQSK